ncbi:MAG: universal stress protein [Dehalococcoidia bacterium]|uniref:universal stress protein n=1 Tax=Candidatus Amarobacter glycogenicus TaxID=3140699 RepID=UPI001D8857CE|nr:universal stress protein [Dehalococcoidia bacterium]MBK6562944.1 universal stress protein [Dehalococcoidia bacterium]MBK7126589.1 universal stress protein [Dehalococcoidia bacterium]MBK7329285.1 universal stress protein [Dehalococcoidia bacterium]MBK7725234.1 universal stress protein [Dehalococcoidia bacterium]
MFELNEVLVPVDFSIASRETFARALAMVDGESPAVILLHVIDPVLVEAISSVTGEPAAAVVGRLRARAEDEMAAMADSAASVEIVRMVTEGTPFYEIARHADELAVDAVVIAKTGQRDAREGLFFGSTAEKVVRACREPVIVLTHDA